MRLCGVFGNSVRLAKGYAEVLEQDKSLTKMTRKIAGRTKTSFLDAQGKLVGTVTEANDGRKITKVVIPEGKRLNGPAEEVLSMIGSDMKPKTKAQEELKQKFLRTSETDMTRLKKGVDVEVVKPNGESTQYFYERGLYAESPYYWGEYKPEAYLDSVYDVQGKLTHIGGDSTINHWILQDVRLVDEGTGMAINIKKPHKYIEWAND